MNKSQKKKAKFRASKKWKLFAHQVSVNQKGLDEITKSKLRKYSAVHHKDLAAEHYEDLSNINNFAYLNHETHKVVHYLYTYYKKDKDVIKRLEQMLEEMYQINEGSDLHV